MQVDVSSSSIHWGRAAYEGACALLGSRPARDLLCSRDRATDLPAWMVPELIATPAARERVRAWSSAGAVEPTADDLVRRLRYLGDGEIRSLVLEALHERVPPPVAAAALSEFLFCGVGFSTAGWMTRCATEPTARLSLILISGATRDARQVLAVLLHEIAHAWLMPEPAAPVRAEEMFNERGAALIAAASRPDLMRAVLGAEARDERQADALAARWGGGHTITCSDERAASYTRHEAARLAAEFGARDDGAHGGKP